MSVQSPESSCYIMMAHYFHHLALVNHYIFITIISVFAWKTNEDSKKYWRDYWFYRDHENKRIFTYLVPNIYPIVHWLCIRYHYHLPLNLLLLSVVMVIEPINFLWCFLRPGTVMKCQAYVLSFYCHDQNITSGQTSFMNIPFGLLPLNGKSSILHCIHWGKPWKQRAFTVGIALACHVSWVDIGVFKSLIFLYLMLELRRCWNTIWSRGKSKHNPTRWRRWESVCSQLAFDWAPLISQLFLIQNWELTRLISTGHQLGHILK